MLQRASWYTSYTFVRWPCALSELSDKGKAIFRSDLESSVAERDHLLAEVERVQAELQGVTEAPAEGEDAAVEEGAVTGTAATHAASTGGAPELTAESSAFPGQSKNPLGSQTLP